MAKKEIKRIDITPKWIGLTPMFFDWLERGNASQRQTAMNEINRMATILDILMEHKNCGGLSCKCGETFNF